MVRALVASGGASTTLASSLIYQPFGPLASLAQGNGLSLNRAYDGNYWLSGVTLSGSAGTLLGLTLTRDANGKVTAVSDSAAPLRNASYSYTDAGRLAAASGTWGADNYTWDANDNRTRADRTVSGTTASDVATLAPGTNRLAELKDGAGVVSRSFTHTPGGDTASVTRPAAPTLAYSYNARGRLSSVTAGGAPIASYAYDWREQRVSASSTEVGSRHYLYADDGQLLAEHDAQTGTLLREYVWLDTMPLAMVSGAISTPTYTWITTGNLNEPLLLTNASGQVTASTTRDPWGNPILLAGGEPLNLGYPGQWKDPATGLSQNWHRDYDPTLGRYIEADPLGLGGGSNLFAYVGGDPVNMIDPMGLQVRPSPRVPPRAPSGRGEGRADRPQGQQLPTSPGPARPSDRYRPGQTFIGPPGSLPTRQQIADARGECLRGETPWTQYGRQAHDNYRVTLGTGYRFNQPLPSGRRPDAVDWTNHIVRELKPGTPRGTRDGNRQLERYRLELEQLTGQPWTAHLDFYRPPGK